VGADVPAPVTIEERSAPPIRARLRAALRDPVWADAILPTIAIRIVLLVGALLLVVVFRPDALSHDDLLAIWNRWDAPHFLEIARYGYGPPADPARIVLFPLFPALIAVGSLVMQPLAAGMLISTLATLASAAGIYRLTRLDHSRQTARLAVLAMNVFPTAFAFVAPYSEAPFLAFVVWSLLAARREEWRAAGFLALLAGATRLQGAFLVPALALEYLVVHRRAGRPLGWLAIGLGGPLIYLAINALTFGDPLYFVGIQKSVFHVQNVAPWDALGGLIRGVFEGDRTESWATVYLAPAAAYVILGLGTAWALLSRRSRPSYSVYSVLNLAMMLTLSWPISLPRYVLGIAPMFIWLGVLGRRPALGQALLVASVILLGACTTLFVTGHWAF
jgi:hypothetical protein